MKFQIQSGTIKDFVTAPRGAWLTVKFPTPFSKDVVPLVFVQIQTHAGGDTPVLRIRNIKNSSFQVRLEDIIVSEATSSVVGKLGLINTKIGHNRKELLAWMAIN